MAKRIYVGVNSVARKAKKAYVGVGGIARKVKKAYVGVGGIARPCMSGELTSYGSITGLSSGKFRIGATSNNNYAIFAGGTRNDQSGWYSDVDAYDSSLVKTVAPSLTSGKEYSPGTPVGNYAVFGGGGYGYNRDEVNAYNQNLVKSNPPSLTYARRYGAAATAGNYALFAGGEYDSSSLNRVDAYNSSLVKSTAPNLSASKAYPYGTEFGDRSHAIFAGGTGSNGTTNTADTYDGSLVKTSISALSAGRYSDSCKNATHVGDYVVVGWSGYVSNIDAYNKNLVRSLIGSYTDVNSNIAFACSLDNEYAIFLPYSSNIVAYDTNLVRILKPVSGRQAGSCASIGNFAIVAGGHASSYIKSAQAFMI